MFRRELNTIVNGYTGILDSENLIETNQSSTLSSILGSLSI